MAFKKQSPEVSLRVVVMAFKTLTMTLRTLTMTLKIFNLDYLDHSIDGMVKVVKVEDLQGHGQGP